MQNNNNNNNKTSFPYFYDPNLSQSVNSNVNSEILKYSGIYVLKKMSLELDEGGLNFSVPLAQLDEYIEPVFDHLMFKELVHIDVADALYAITDKGFDFIQNIIDEAEDYIDRYSDFDPKTRINLILNDNLNPLRVRFLWGLYDGEFDDFDSWQDNLDFDFEQRIDDWRLIITRKEFYDILFEEINSDSSQDHNGIFDQNSNQNNSNS